MPLDFAAFCELHHPHYTDYARLRLTPPTADHAVESTFGDLAIHWPRILRCPNPATWAWNTLKTRITQALPPTPNPPAITSEHPTAPGRGLMDSLRTVLPNNHLDTVTLHLALHLTPTQITDITGTDPATVAYHLRTAERHLTGHNPTHQPATPRQNTTAGNPTR